MLERFWPLRRLNASNDKLWIGRDQETQEEVVMKLIEVSDDEIKNQQVKMEAHALKMFSDMDPFRIVGFRSFYVNTERQFVICMEMGKCSLAESLAFRPVLTEEEARTIVRCILEALVTVHSKRFVHRDVKPENLILFSDELDSLKLGDFGICDEDNGYNSCGGIKGTKGYMAPEILKKEQYGRAVDIWSTGCVAFQLVYGRLPFVSPIKTSILGSKPKLVFPDMYPVSEQGKAFIAALLQENPDMRPTAAEALEHPWLSGAPLATQHPNTLQIPHSQSFSQSSSYNYPPPQSLTVPAPRTPSPKGIFPLGRQTPSPVAQFASLAPSQTGLFAAKRQTPSPAPAIPPQSEFPERHFFPYSAPGAPPGSKYAAPIPTMRVSTDSDEEEEIPLESRRKNASTQSRNSAPEASISRDFQIDVGGLVGAKTPVPAPSPAPAPPAPTAANKVNEKLVRFNDDITVGYSLGDGDGSDVSPVGDAIELPQNSPPSRWLEDDELARTVSTKVQVSFGGSEDSQKNTAAGNTGQYESFDISDDQSNQFFQSPLDGADGWNCVIVPKDTV
ncbi:hypothetical protein HDU84_001969 [Entophlyctis sp. JEL0112]|nr:hypothetical protein HDU84_001969 [Entophlyctis sp. JEL0112]